jgi:hypothetical protein
MMSTQSNEEEHIFANELRSAGPEGSGRKTLENGLDESGYRMKLQSSYARTSYTLLLLRCNVMQLKIEVNIQILSATSR